MAIVKPDTICPVASHGSSIVLALEVAAPWWQASRVGGGPPPDPPDEHCQPALGRPADSWGTAQARYRYRTDECGEDMVRRRGAPSQGWKTFVRNHADGIAAMDPFVVPTISFRLLYGLLIMAHGRRQILRLGVTAHPT